MIDDERGIVRLVALFPHEDAQRELRFLRARLFRRGIAGARALPLFAPLDDTFLQSCGLQASRPASRIALALVARALAEALDHSGHLDRAGSQVDDEFPDPGAVADRERGNKAFRFSSAESALSAWSAYPSSLLVLRLHPPAPSLVMAVLRKGDDLRQADFLGSAPVRFNAAFVANLAIRRLEADKSGLSFEWERGAPVWLPPAGKNS